MISQVDLARSLDSYGAQSAATPASISHPLPPGKATGEAIEPSQSTDHVSISAEGVRQFQRAAELEEQQAITRKAVGENAELAARMAHDMAYRREVVIVPPAAYSNLAKSLYVSGTSPATNAVTIARAQSGLEQARLARISLYELETAKGTPAAEIYDRLLALTTSQPAGYSVAIAA